MKTTIVQMNIEWAQPDANLAKAEKAIMDAPTSDLYILPEMFSTGFCTEPEGVADHELKALKWMQATALKMNAAICGSVATQEEDKYYNRFYFVEPNGNTTIYNKHHLFSYGGEDKRFTPGTSRQIVCYHGVRILLEVCYDLRFPVWSRNTQAQYDMAIYVASWPITRQDAWNTLTKARAIENQCYVAAVNRVGKDPYCTYAGGSAIINPYGKAIATCKDGEETTAHADIDMETLAEFRKKFPVLLDADPYQAKGVNL